MSGIEQPSEELSRPWLLPVALFATTLAVFVATAADYYANWDAYASSVAAWRIATTGVPWMEGVDFDALTGLKDGSVWQAEINGHVVTTRMFGPILAAVPFYWVNAYHDEASFSVYRGGIAASVFVAAAAVLLFQSYRRQVGEVTAMAGTAVFAFTTPAWSVGANALWTHPMTMFGLAGAALGASRDRWWLAGFSLGVGMWARPHIGIVAAIIGLGLALRRRRPAIAVAVAVPTTLSLMMLTVWNRFVFGSWHPLGAYSDREVKAVVPDFGEGLNQFQNVAGFLVSPDRGFLVWTPIVLVLLPAVTRAWRDVPDWSRWLAVGGVAYTALQLGLNYFGGSAGFYGYRHGLELLVCITPLYVLALREVGRIALRIAPVVVALQFAIIAPGAVFETFYVHPNNAWVNNSFWFALRSYPAVFAPYLVLCLGAGIFISSRISRVHISHGELVETRS